MSEISFSKLSLKHSHVFRIINQDVESLLSAQQIVSSELNFAKAELARLESEKTALRAQLSAKR
jgi:hypothetical protein